MRLRLKPPSSSAIFMVDGNYCSNLSGNGRR
jgi:hypothetical protein